MSATSPDTKSISSHDFARQILAQPDMPLVISPAFPGREVVDPDVPELSIHTHWDAPTLGPDGMPVGDGIKHLVIYPRRAFDEESRSVGIDPSK